MGAVDKKSRNNKQGYPARNIAPEFKREPDKSRPRRAWFHDYCASAYYHITATTVEGSPLLSSLPDVALTDLHKCEVIYPDLTELGRKIETELLSISSFHPEIRLLQYVIMPDHIHFALHVKERLEKMLGCELAGFFGACSRHYNRLYSLPEFKSLFSTFHDRLIFNYNQLEKVMAYIRDNPRRALIKRNNPALFRRYLHLNVGNQEYAAFGNIFLLRHYNLMPVRIHRRWSEAEFAAYEDDCMRKVSHGAIPVSPFIHPAEKKIMIQTLETGGSVIRLTDCGFEDRFKPRGKDFEICAEGRLLLLAPWPQNVGRKSTAGYKEFHTMNDLAVEIASMSPETRLILKK